MYVVVEVQRVCLYIVSTELCVKGLACCDTAVSQSTCCGDHCIQLDLQKFPVKSLKCSEAYIYEAFDYSKLLSPIIA